MKFFVNKNEQPNGDHEVHRANCSWLPQPGNCLYLGEFTSSYEALKAAKRIYNRADGCVYCCPEIHHS